MGEAMAASELTVIVLGAGAGGGFPQWNSNSVACRRARAGDPAARPATQASIAVSADGMHWFLVNASPDLREQINREPALYPDAGGAIRSTPIAGVILTNGDVDAVAGLLNLREKTPFGLFAHPRIHAVLDANPIFGVLDRGLVRRHPLALDIPLPLPLADGRPSGLTVTPFAVPGKIALYLESDARPDLGGETGDTIGLEVHADGSGKRLLFVANCAAVDAPLRDRLAGADLLFFDGTLWADDEMVQRQEGVKTGRRMGHISMSGPAGAMAALRPVTIGRRLFIHINNTNPALLADSPERRAVEQQQWEIAHDGLRVTL